MAIDAAKTPAGECGVENQVGRVGAFYTGQIGGAFSTSRLKASS